MNNPAVFKLLCLRHGKTNYTDVFPDLTIAGVAHVRKVAEEIVVPWMQKDRVNLSTVMITTSPAARALGTAAHIANVIGHQVIFLPERKIGPMEKRDVARAALVYEALSAGKRYVSYEKEPAFQDPMVFETPSEVRARWYAFFADYLDQALLAGKRHAILVSHYEVLCNLVFDLFGIEATEETELRHAEPIFLSVSSRNTEQAVTISGTFREKEAHAVFDLRDRSFKHLL